MGEGSTAELVLEAGSRTGRLAAFREVWGFRGTVLAFAERDIRVQYKQAVFGIVWAVIQPLILMAVFTLTLGHLAKSPEEGSTTRPSPSPRSFRGPICRAPRLSERTRCSATQRRSDVCTSRARCRSYRPS